MLIRLIDWYLNREGYERIKRVDYLDLIPDNVVLLTSSAMPLVSEIEKAPQGGEWKKHQVYARMLKMFKEEKKKDISWAIERAVRCL
jgi:hypothetical protein